MCNCGRKSRADRTQSPAPAKSPQTTGTPPENLKPAPSSTSSTSGTTSTEGHTSSFVLNLAGKQRGFRTQLEERAARVRAAQTRRGGSTS